MTVDEAMNLLVQAARVDPMLREAAHLVDAEHRRCKAQRDALADALREIEDLSTWSMIDHRGETILLGGGIREIIRGKARDALDRLERDS